MTKGRGKNAPDRADIKVVETEVLSAEEHTLAPLVELPNRAQEMWDLIVDQTRALNLIKPEDSPLLMAYCMSWHVYCDAKDNYEMQLDYAPLARTREISEAGTKRNVDLQVMSSELKNMTTLARQLGISPLARAQLNLTTVAAASMAADLPKKIAELYKSQTPKKKLNGKKTK